MANEDKLQGLEFRIYTQDQSGKADKEPTATKTEMAEAFSAAEEMIQSGKYLKVEVKQKYFDKKKNRDVDMTLKVLHGKKKIEINATMIFVFAVLCGGLAFAVTYFLAR